jgi:outer membrane protein OmpA-like peptidoglycan-associated protein
MRRALGIAWGLASSCARPAPAPAQPVPPPIASHKPKGRVVVTDTDIQLLPPIKFVGPSATIDVVSIRALDAIASTLDGNPSILLVEIDGYGSDGVPPYQQVLGKARARAVMDYLIKRNVARWRLRAEGGAVAPQGLGTVVFWIVQRAS